VPFARENKERRMIPWLCKSLENAIKAKAKEVGYEACGIIEAALFKEFLAGLEERSALFPHAAPFYEQIKGLVNPKPQETIS
jgi:epoxyqueuosine reductase